MGRERSGRRSRSRSREKSRRSRSRDRTRRARSPDRSSRRSRSRSQDRSASKSQNQQQWAPSSGGDFSLPPPPGMPDGSLSTQQQTLQNQILQQQVLLQQQALSGQAQGSATKKQREVYVGNLAIGIITDTVLRDLFNGALAHLVPDPVNNPPVINVNMDPAGGRYAFVEMRTEELATIAMNLDKVEVCSRSINVGRPKGYVEALPTGVATQARVGMAQMFAAQLSGGATNVVLMENLASAAGARGEYERNELYQDVLSECSKTAAVFGVALPTPPPTVGDSEPCRVYVKFGSSEDASRVKEVMEGRIFDANTVKVCFATELDFSKALQGQWAGSASNALVMV